MGSSSFPLFSPFLDRESIGCEKRHNSPSVIRVGDPPSGRQSGFSWHASAVVVGGGRKDQARGGTLEYKIPGCFQSVGLPDGYPLVFLKPLSHI